MNVSALEEYGLRCALRLASLSPTETLSAPEIAEYEGLSVEYVSKFMLHLKRADLVRTVRGIKGGFALSRAPSSISLKEVFDALSSKRKFSEEFCQSFAGKSGECVRMNGCAIRPFWQTLAFYIDEFTSELTLQDLVAPDSAKANHFHALAKKSAVRSASDFKKKIKNNAEVAT